MFTNWKIVLSFCLGDCRQQVTEQVLQGSGIWDQRRRVLFKVRINLLRLSRIGYEGQDFAGHGGAGQGYPDYLEWLRSKGHELGVKPWDGPTTMI